MRTYLLSFFLIFSLLSIQTFAETCNPSLCQSQGTMTCLSTPITASGLNYCKKFDGQQICCSVDSINQIRAYILSQKQNLTNDAMNIDIKVAKVRKNFTDSQSAVNEIDNTVSTMASVANSTRRRLLRNLVSFHARFLQSSTTSSSVVVPQYFKDEVNAAFLSNDATGQVANFMNNYFNNATYRTYLIAYLQDPTFQTLMANSFQTNTVTNAISAYFQTAQFQQQMATLQTTDPQLYQKSLVLKNMLEQMVAQGIATQSSSTTKQTVKATLSGIINFSQLNLGQLISSLHTPDIKQNFKEFQQARQKCFVHLMQLGTKFYCMACMNSTAQSQFYSNNKLTLNQQICTDIQTNCADYAIIAQNISHVASQYTQLQTFYGNLKTLNQQIKNLKKLAKSNYQTVQIQASGQEILSTYNAMVSAAASITQDQTEYQTSDCLSTSSCQDICYKFISGSNLQVAFSSLNDIASGSRLLTTTDVSFSSTSYDPNTISSNAEGSVSFSTDPASVGSNSVRIFISKYTVLILGFILFALIF